MAGVSEARAAEVTGEPFFHWAKLLSPLGTDDLREEAWAALDLPGTFAERKSVFWGTFHVGSPAPPVPFIMHAAIGTEGGAAREDWMRVISYLGLSWAGSVLAPDHLAVACEVYGCAIAAREPVLVRELADRYVLPWCEAATGKIAGTDCGLEVIVSELERDVKAARASAAVEAAA